MTLGRTKTTGIGKKHEELYLYVDAESYFAHPSWLKFGFEIWASSGSEREYLLVLPSPSLDDVIHLEAKCADCQALYAALLRHLRMSDGRPMFFADAGPQFGSQQSERATLISFSAYIPSIPEDWLDHLGRWSPKVSQGYVRTHGRRTSTIQRTVASFIRAGKMQLGAFGEDYLYARWAAYMHKHGATQELAVEQASRLASVAASWLPKARPARRRADERISKMRSSNSHP